jgi:hypothetical protein
MIQKRLARIGESLDRRDALLAGINVRLDEQDFARQNIVLLLAGVAAGLRAAAAMRDEHSKAGARFGEIASDVEAIQRWASSNGSYPEKD